MQRLIWFKKLWDASLDAGHADPWAHCKCQDGNSFELRWHCHDNLGWQDFNEATENWHDLTNPLITIKNHWVAD